MFVSQLTKNKDICWQSLWNRGLVALFIILYFMNDVTRYKKLVVIMMYITAIVYIFKEKKNIINLFKNNIFLSVLLFTATALYSVFISIDPGYSFSKFLNTIVEKLLIACCVIPIILSKESKEKTAKLLIYSLCLALVPLILTESIQYLREYRDGIMPFSTPSHKLISDALIFITPALLFLWTNGNKKTRIIFLAVAIISAFLIFGTLQRGTWLSISIGAVIFFLCKKEWKIPALSAIVLLCTFAFAYTQHKDDLQFLFYKLQQTSSSNRYGNGTQGSAVDLIMENPIKGYGFGENIFYDVYNKKVNEYPQWIYKQSIGPHNLTLSVWYAQGILGLFALWYMLLSFAKGAIAGYRNSTGLVRDGWLLIIIILVSNLGVRGLFETVRIENLAILLGIAIALRKPE